MVIIHMILISEKNLLPFIVNEIRSEAASRYIICRKLEIFDIGPTGFAFVHARIGRHGEQKTCSLPPYCWVT